MASPIEEKFVRENLTGNSVFEFGCSPGRFAIALSRDGYAVYGCDLYDAEFQDGYSFFKGDFIEMEIGGYFDNIIAVSSIEHCGIESADFKGGDQRNLTYHIGVAKKLSSMVTPINRLIVTVPFGKENIYYVDKDGNNGSSDEIRSPAWGYRTFTKESISRLFKDLNMVSCVAYGKVGQEYLDINSWVEIDLNSFDKYDNKSRAVMCCIFNRGEISEHL